MKTIINLFLKGAAIGAANIVPGVSGGTLALVTGIFERLIDAIKSFDLTALKLLLKAKFKDFAKHTDLLFLLIVFSGALIGIFSLAQVLSWLFKEYAVYVWAYFFGLILASVLFVGRRVEKYNLGVVLSFIIGTAIAVSLSLINPATENDNFFYLILCGMAGVISMIMPGLSGSFILILMGNYQLVMIDAVNGFDMEILLPVAIGIVIGLPAFSGMLSFLYKKYRDITIATLSGFILGSLLILWPWQKPVFLQDEFGLNVLKSNGEPVIVAYDKYIPEVIDTEVLIAFAVMLIGILTIWGIEFIASRLKLDKEEKQPVA
jgi:putative membrane protein